LGFRIIVYLDDFPLVHQDPDVLAAQTGRTLACLEFLGLKVNYKKSFLSPMHGVQFLGIFWNPTADLKRLPLSIIETIASLVKGLIASRRWSWIQGKRLMGFLNFDAFVVPFSKIHYRTIQLASIQLPQEFPDEQYQIPLSAVTELQWWLTALPRGSNIFPPANQNFITTDASDSG